MHGPPQLPQGRDPLASEVRDRGRRGGLQHDRPYLAFMTDQAGACREKLRTQAVTPGGAAEYLDDKRQGRTADLSGESSGPLWAKIYPILQCCRR